MVKYLPFVEYLGFDINCRFIEEATKKIGNRGTFLAKEGLVRLCHTMPVSGIRFLLLQYRDMCVRIMKFGTWRTIKRGSTGVWNSLN